MSKFRFVKEFLNLSSTEKIGIWILLVIAVAFPLLSFFVPLSSNNKSKTDVSAFEQQISSWEKAVAEQNNKQNVDFTLQAPNQSATKSKLDPFNFDPNLLSTEEWIKLGLTDKQTSSIMKFRQKGGVFKTKSDFKRMYMISEGEYAVLEPFILLPEKIDYTANNHKKEYKEPAPVELNSADSAALDAVKGIGPSLSRRIITYRSKLHGFISIEQLREVYGLDSAQYSTISPRLFVNPYLVNKINVNKADLTELRNHPYIGNNVALSIVNYRKQHGDYQLLTDIKKSALVTDEVYQKISPYLTVQ